MKIILDVIWLVYVILIIKIYSYLKNKFPNTKIIQDANQILNDEKIDIVSVASYDNHHCEQIVKAIQNNKHVMAEKPICLNEDELKKIQNAQNKKIVKLFYRLI